MRRPRPQADGARGAPHLSLRFSAKRSPSAPWARGLLLAFWERGSPDFPACGLWRGSSGGPVRPIFISARLKTLAGRMIQGFLRSGLARQAHEEAERSRQGTSRGARDASHDDRDQASASGAQSTGFLFGAKAAGVGDESRGIRQRFPYRCNKTKTRRTAGRRSPWSPRWRHRQCF